MGKEGTILVVDDEQDIREMIQFQLESAGFEVVTAENGVEGLKQLQTIEPNLIILDMNMPEMSGIEFYREICDDDNKAKFPIIALTAQVRIEELFEGFNIEAYIAKPFNMDQLIKTVKLTMLKK